MVRVIKVTEPLVLEFLDGTTLRIDPPGKRRGRPLSPAAVALKTAMERDLTRGKAQGRAHYLKVLRDAGHSGSEASASLIVSREAKRIFGTSLGRQKGLKRKRRGGQKRGRSASHETNLLRDKLKADKANNSLGDAKHYVSWLMDQPGVKMGLKPARPIVYRELRAIR